LIWECVSRPHIFFLDDVLQHKKREMDEAHVQSVRWMKPMSKINADLHFN